MTTPRLRFSSFGLALSLALTGALSLPASEARADDDAAKKTQAANFFDAGADAYKAGKYQVAAEAFEKAYALLPSASLLFSAAQAYRRQYLSEPSPDSLKKAIGLYRDYLKADPKANRREDAMEALGVLVPLERALVPIPVGDGNGTQAAPEAPKTTKTARLLLTASHEGAEVSLDGGAFSPAPLVAQVDPGPHRARIRAKGFDEQDVAVVAVANELVPQHVSLHPKPARLEVKGTDGAKVAVDGQVRATVPTTGPVLLDPGSHFVAVTLAGHEPKSERVEIGRDEGKTIEASLPLTRQRILAWSALSTGAAGLIATGVLTGLTFSRQSDALALSDRPKSNPLSGDERDRFNQAVRDRNDFGQAAAVAGGVSALFLVTGAALFAFDDPDVVVPGDAQPGSPSKSGPRTTFEVGLGSVTVRGTF